MVAAHTGSGAVYGIAVGGCVAYVRPVAAAVRALLPLVGRGFTPCGGADGKGSLRALGHRLACGLGGDAGGRDRCAAAQVARHGAASLHEDCTIVGQLSAGVEGRPIRDGQGLAALNFKVILQFHLAVHGAFRAVKDDAAAIITRWCRRRKRFRNS